MDMDEIETVDREFARCIAAGDAEGAAAFYAEDAMFLVPQAEPFEGRLGVKRFVQFLIDSGMRSVRFEPLQIKDSGDLVVEYGRYEMQLPNDLGVDIGKYIVIHERQADGTMKIVYDIFNTSKRAGS